MGRNIAAIAGGFLLWTVCWLGFNAIISRAIPASFNTDGSTNSTGILVAFLLASAAFSILSGWILPKLARQFHTAHAWILGGILLLVGLFVQISFWDAMPVWYHVLFLGLLIPATYLGHRLHKKEAVAA